MKLHKKILISILCIIPISILLTSCNNYKHNTNQSKSIQSSHKVISSSQKNNYNNHDANKSSIKNSAPSSKSKYTKINDKRIGVMIALLKYPKWFKENIKNHHMYYNSGNTDASNYSSITASGDPTSYIYYKDNNNNIIYKYLIPGKDIASGKFESHNVQLGQLVKDYYTNNNQKNEVNEYVNKLKTVKLN